MGWGAGGQNYTVAGSQAKPNHLYSCTMAPLGLERGVCVCVCEAHMFSAAVDGLCSVVSQLLCVKGLSGSISEVFIAFGHSEHIL